MIRRLVTSLGTARLQALFALFALTGLGSLMLNSVIDESPWAKDVQNVLVAIWLFGTVAIVISALDAFERGRWIGILVPAAGAIMLGILFPQLLGLMIGMALGWIVAGALIFRPRSPEEYRLAIKHLRKSEYKEAIEQMSALIKEQPKEAGHYRFRAELFRIWGKLDRARRDYKAMIDIAPDMAVAWNGLAEVELQSGDFDTAKQAALKALALAPDEWVATYNLGMIEDRIGDAQNATIHLQQALSAKVPDARHRLLIYLYLARAYARLGQLDEANEAIQQLKKHQGGLNEWEVILQSEQAETLRNVIQADIDQIQAIINGNLTAESLV